MPPVNRSQKPFLQRTPVGAAMPTDTPVSVPLADPLASFASWLANPKERYGALTSPEDAPIWILRRMLYDPVISLCIAFMGGILVKAEYEINCDDPVKQAFFEQMYRPLHFDYMLQGLPARLFGFQAMTKELGFVEATSIPAWQGSAQPFVLKGFTQLAPGRVTVMREHGHFAGIQVDGGDTIPPLYSLWITQGKELAFGDYYGHGCLRAAYTSWWKKQFAADLEMIQWQKSVQPSPVVTFPNGKASDGIDNREHARALAEGHLAGAPVVLPSSVYQNRDETLTSIRQWGMEYIDAPGDVVSRFRDIFTALDAAMCAACIVSPQTFFDVKSGLGGSDTARTLSDIAGNSLMIGAVESDRHLNEYVFKMIDRYNFPPGGPPVIKTTKRISTTDQSNIKDVLGYLASDPARAAAMYNMIDEREVLERLEVPLRSKAEAAAAAAQQLEVQA